MNRSASIDLLRGFIMMLMALDHASGMIARVHFTEMWGVDFNTYPSLAWWFTRFVSHLCAPGFFFLMGMSIYLFGHKRLEAGWSMGKINMYFLKRGGLILLFMFFLELPAWLLGMSFNEVRTEAPALPGLYEGGFLIPTTVLYGLGACMMLGGLFWRQKEILLFLISVLSFGWSGWYISQAAVQVAYHPLQHFLWVPGMSKGAMILYPIIPWLGVTTFGMFWASMLKRKPQQFYRWSLGLGLLFIVAFLGIRLLEWGNFQKSTYDDWISFFTLIKYPPSICFILLTCGINLILLYGFSLLSEQKWMKPVKVFGQTAMFFYIVHLYFYAVVGIAFPNGCAIQWMYVLWIGGLIFLYFICSRFLTFKKQTPLNSFWRMV